MHIVTSGQFGKLHQFFGAYPQEISHPLGSFFDIQAAAQSRVSA